jgi:hypothetical protein
MAVTITRSVWIDDDGTGTTGTVINQALHTTLYNEIDTALAKVAQLTGGNTFTGNQWITGQAALGFTSSVSGHGLSISGDAGAAKQGIAIVNTSTNNTLFYLTFYGSAFTVIGSIVQTSASTVVFNTTSDARLKRDHGRASDLDALRAVIVHDFTWTADGVRSRGVFAQETAAVFPRAITEGTDERTAAGSLARPWQTDYSKFVPDLIVGWQQHDAALAAIRARLATLDGAAV